jgi:hypothetical protein
MARIPSHGALEDIEPHRATLLDRFAAREVESDLERVQIPWGFCPASDNANATAELFHHDRSRDDFHMTLIVFVAGIRKSYGFFWRL